MEEDMIMNVPSAPEMQGTPMAPDLSMEMQPQMADVSQAEMQEAQGALMQILQVINMLIEQGLNAEQIRAFLEQYGISEDELDQAAQALGVDIDMVLSGQMQAPQEPMMMAAGGPSISEIFMNDPIKNITEAAMANPGDFLGQTGSRLSDSDIMLAKELLAQIKFGRGMFKTQEEIQEILKRRLTPRSKLTIMPPMMMAEGGPGVLDPNDLPDDIKTQLENIYRKIYLSNLNERGNRRPNYKLITEDERELLNKYNDGRLRRDAPLVAKYMDLIGFDNIGDDNPLLASAKLASTALGLSGAIPTSRIRRRLNPDAGILSDPIKDTVLAERKEIYGYAEGGPGLDEKKN